MSKLRLNAHFPVDAPIAAQPQSAPFDIEQGHDDQLVLPILADEPFKARRDVEASKNLASRGGMRPDSVRNPRKPAPGGANPGALPTAADGIEAVRGVHVVLSVKPVHADKILTGEKTVELRRRFPVAAPHGALAYIYSSSPVKAMVGTASIRDVLKLPVEQIWAEFESAVFIGRPLFDKYFKGLQYGYAIVLEDARLFSRPLPLHELRKKFGFEPPQSFLYARHNLRRALQNEPSSVSH